MKTQIRLLLLTLIIFCSCKKDSTFSNPEVIVSNEGMLRVECNNCKVSYQINNKEYTAEINGSNDLPFYYVSDFDFKTEIVSNEEQNIRLMVIDSFGRIVSNELNGRLKGEISKMSFAISTR